MKRFTIFSFVLLLFSYICCIGVLQFLALFPFLLMSVWCGCN